MALCAFLKREKGVIQFYFRKIPLQQYNFWWFSFFLIHCGAKIFEKMPKMKLLSVFQLATQKFIFSVGNNLADSHSKIRLTSYNFVKLCIRNWPYLIGNNVNFCVAN